MNNADYEEVYGPPALNPPYKVGQTLFYEEDGIPENGEILYVAADPDLRYIVSPAEAVFPTPVWPDQVITAM